MNSAIEKISIDCKGAIQRIGDASTDSALDGLSRLRCCISIDITPDPFGVKPILSKAVNWLSQPDYTINPNYYAKFSLMASLHAAFSANPKIAERSLILIIIIIRTFIAYPYIFFNAFYF